MEEGLSLDVTSLCSCRCFNAKLVVPTITLTEPQGSTGFHYLYTSDRVTVREGGEGVRSLFFGGGDHLECPVLSGCGSNQAVF